ncbi:MAG: c-type cytochrome [Ginsengibacter sp.]
MKKSIVILFGCIICVVLFQAFTTTSDPEFQNLQILPKDISEHDLDSVMHHFSQSLGVKCNFCHVFNNDTKKMNFVLDEKPEKNIARKMMLMAIDLNKNYFADMDMDQDMDHKDMDMDKDKMDKGKMDKDKMDKGHNMDDKMMNKNPMDTAVSKNVGYMLMEVNCYTCHRGETHPNSKLPPPPPRPQGPPPTDKPADNK